MNENFTNVFAPKDFPKNISINDGKTFLIRNSPRALFDVEINDERLCKNDE